MKHDGSIGVPPEDFDLVVQTLTFWPTRVRPRLLDIRPVMPALSLADPQLDAASVVPAIEFERSMILQDAETHRTLAYRRELLDRPSGPPLFEPTFWVAPDVLIWCARELKTQVFVVAGACLSAPCRCRGLAGSRLFNGRRRVRLTLADPPMHPGCSCFLAPAAIRYDPAAADRLQGYVARGGAGSIGSSQGRR